MNILATNLVARHKTSNLFQNASTNVHSTNIQIPSLSSFKAFHNERRKSQLVTHRLEPTPRFFVRNFAAKKETVTKKRLDTNASKFLEEKFLKKRVISDQMIEKYAEQLELEVKQVKAWWKRRTQKEEGVKEAAPAPEEKKLEEIEEADPLRVAPAEEEDIAEEIQERSLNLDTEKTPPVREQLVTYAEMKQMVELVRDGSVTPQAMDKSAERTLRAVLIVDGSFLYTRIKRHFRLPPTAPRAIHKYFYALPKLVKTEISRLQLGRPVDIVRTIIVGAYHEPIRRDFFYNLRTDSTKEVAVFQSRMSHPSVLKDIKIATEIVDHASEPNIDLEIVAVNSKNFAPALHKAKERGKSVYIAGWADKYFSSVLKEDPSVRDNVVYLDKLLEQRKQEVFNKLNQTSLKRKIVHLIVSYSKKHLTSGKLTAPCKEIATAILRDHETRDGALLLRHHDIGIHGYAEQYPTDFIIEKIDNAAGHKYFITLINRSLV